MVLSTIRLGKTIRLSCWTGFSPIFKQLGKTIPLSYRVCLKSVVVSVRQSDCLTDTAFCLLYLVSARQFWIVLSRLLSRCLTAYVYIYIYKTIVQDNSIVLLILLHLLHLPITIHDFRSLFSSFVKLAGFDSQASLLAITRLVLCSKRNSARFLRVSDQFSNWFRPLLDRIASVCDCSWWFFAY